MKIEYSQNKLHDYLECPRRYELKYQLQQIWPAVLTEPVLQHEEFIKNGKTFHLCAQQFFLGIDPQLIKDQIENPLVLSWWNRFLEFAFPLLSFQHQAEVIVQTRINQSSFIGVFDLLVYIPGEKFMIIDWKTNHHKPKRNSLKDHTQTRLYPLLLTEAGAAWNNGQRILPYQIEMIYWFTNQPDSPESFQYSEQQYQLDKEYYQNLINEIENRKPNEFQLTEDQRYCKFCNYRSLCGRGIKPGSIDEWDEMDDEFLFEEILDIDMNQIAEISF